MSALNISPKDVSTALAQNNSLSAIGSTKGNMIRVNLTANTDLTTAEEFENLVVREVDGSLIRLKDVADVVLGSETYDDEVRFSGNRATFMGIYVLPNANSVDVVKKIRTLLPDIQKQLPAGMQVKIPYDSTEYINDSIHEVIKTLAETVIIVIIVIFLFIGSMRAVIVPVVAIPLSLIGACAMMAAFGFTINLLTLLAIVLAVGLVVDDAIVMLENVERHINEEGLDPIPAAIKAARELVGPVIAMTITLATVYTPIAFQGGLTGALFREFALTLSGAVFISGFVALTLSPMMASRLLTKHGNDPKAKRTFQDKLNDFFEKMRCKYHRMLNTSLDAAPVIIVVSVLITLLILPFSMFSKKELAPTEDQGIIFNIIQVAPDATLEQNLIFTNRLLDIFNGYDEKAQTFLITRVDSAFGGFVAKPWSERKRTVMDLKNDMAPKLSKIPGVRVIPIIRAPLPGGSDFKVEFVLQSTNEPRQIYEFSQQILNQARTSGKFMFIDSDLKYDLPQSEIVIDKDKVASMGLNMQQISQDLGAMLGGNYINRFSISGRSYKVIPQIKRTGRLTAEQLKDIYITGPNEQLLPLSSFANIQNSVQPRQLNKFQQLNSVKLQGELLPGTSLDDALKYLEDIANQILPPDYSYDYSGESRQLRQEGSSLITTFILAGFLIYLVLAAQFESFRDPFIIIFGSVPLAVAGAMMFTFLGIKDVSINIYTQVGLITLVGLVSKNGILIVEFANSLMEKGLSKREAILEGASTRFRPVLMTSVATVFGHLALCFVTGAGAAARNNIGIILVSGMAIGTIFTLFVVPSLYLFIASEKHVSPTKTDDEELEPKMSPVSTSHYHH
jgi:multidrug efflux pump